MPEELKYFNRIGQYDFTKKDKDKIEPLPENYTKPYIMHATSLEEYRIIDIGDISKKINELVEVVNRLEEKVNECMDDSRMGRGLE